MVVPVHNYVDLASQAGLIELHLGIKDPFTLDEQALYQVKKATHRP